MMNFQSVSTRLLQELSLEDDWLACLNEAWGGRYHKRDALSHVIRQAHDWQRTVEGGGSLKVMKAVSVLHAFLVSQEGRNAYALTLLGGVLDGERTQSIWEVRALSLKVGVCAELGDPASSLAAATEQLQLARQLQDEYLEAGALHDLGVMHNERESIQGEGFLQQAEGMFLRIGAMDGLAYTRLNLAHAYILQGKTDMAHRLLTDVDEMAQLHHLPSVSAYALAFRAALDMAERPKQAEILFREALRQQRNLGDRPLWEAIEPYSRLLIRQGRPAEALGMVTEFFDASSALGLRTAVMKAHLLFADIYEALGDPQRALQHHKHYLQEYRQQRDEEYEQQMRVLYVQQQTERRVQSEQQRTEQLSRLNLSEDSGQDGAGSAQADPSPEDSLASASLIQRATAQLAKLTGASSTLIERVPLPPGQTEGNIAGAEQVVLHREDDSCIQVSLSLPGQEHALVTLQGVSAGTRLVEAAARVLQRQLNEAQLLHTVATQREVLRDLVFAFSHDLRAPLAASAMQVEATLRGAYGEFPESYLDMLRHALTANRGLQHLADQILLVAETETGGLEGDERTILNLQETVQDVLSTELIYWQTREVIFEQDMVRAEVLGRPFDLRRAIQNLLDNAVKFSPAGGLIRVVLRREEGQATLEVWDQGPGVPEKQQPHLFHRFRASHKASGTGIGLYLTRRILEQHGGTLQYERRPDQAGVPWTIFSLTLPLQRVENHVNSPN